MTETKAFHANIEIICEQYDQLAAENAKLRNENALLKAKISVLQKNQNNQQVLQHTPSDTSTKKASRRQKLRLQIDWLPIQYDFSDSVLCVQRYDNKVAFGTADSNVVIFNSIFDKNGTLQFTPFAKYKGHSGAINCIVSDPNTGLFASCSGDRTIHIWSCLFDDNYSAQPIGDSDNSILNIKSDLILSHHTGPVLSASWLTNDNLITGSSDSSVCLWDVAHSQNCIHVENLPSAVICTDAARTILSMAPMKKGQVNAVGTSSFTSNLPSGNSMSSKSKMSSSGMSAIANSSQGIDTSAGSSTSSPVICYAAGLANGEVRFFDPRQDGSVMNVSHSKGQIVSCKFVAFDNNNVTAIGNNVIASGPIPIQTTPNSSKGRKGRSSNAASSPSTVSNQGNNASNIISPPIPTDAKSSGLVDSSLMPSNQPLSPASNENVSNISSSAVNSSIVSSDFRNESFSYYSFITAGSDKSLREWDLRMPQEQRISYDIDHVPTKIDVVNQCVAVPTETGRPRFVNFARSSIVPFGSMPFSYTVSSCSFLTDDASKLVMASWDGTASIAQFEMKSV